MSIPRRVRGCKELAGDLKRICTSEVVDYAGNTMSEVWTHSDRCRLGVGIRLSGRIRPC